MINICCTNLKGLTNSKTKTQVTSFCRNKYKNEPNNNKA